jgi:Yip1 domain
MEEVQGPPPKGLPARIVGLWFSPRETFADIVRAPRFWVPIVALVVINLAFTAVWLQKVDVTEFFKVQLENSGQMAKIQPDQLPGIIETQSKFFPVMAWSGAALGAPLFVLVLAAFFLFVYRFFYAGDFKFGQSMGIVAHAFLAVGVITVPLALVTLFLKGDWAMNPQEATQANVSLFLDRDTPSPALYRLAQSVDLFSIWLVILLATGYAVASRKATGAALWGVAIPWFFVVGAAVAWKALI